MNFFMKLLKSKIQINIILPNEEQPVPVLERKTVVQETKVKETQADRNLRYRFKKLERWGDLSKSMNTYYVTEERVFYGMSESWSSVAGSFFPEKEKGKALDAYLQLLKTGTIVDPDKAKNTDTVLIEEADVHDAEVHATLIR